MTADAAPAAAQEVRPVVATPPGRNRKRNPVARFLGHGVVNVVLILLALFWMIPTIGLFIASLRTSAANSSSGWWTVFTAPAQLTLENYRALLDNSTMIASFWNSVAITVPTTILVVVIGALAGYALAWVDFKGRDTVLVVIIALLAVPLQVAFIPLARLFGSIGIFGSIAGVIAFHVAFGLPFAIFLLRNFFTQVPGELLEASRLDGAGEWRIFSRIVLPLGLPAIASLAIFQFLWTWNDMLVALIFSSPASQPITVALQSQLRQFASNLDILASGAFLSMIVPLIVFFAFQRYFVSALLAGSNR